MCDVGGDVYIARIGKRGPDCFNMVGVAYFMDREARLIADAVEDAYGTAGYEALFWDDVVNSHLDEIRLCVHSVAEGKIAEIDTVEEWEAVSRKFGQ